MGNILDEITLEWVIIEIQVRVGSSKLLEKVEVKHIISERTCIPNALRFWINV